MAVFKTANGKGKYADISAREDLIHYILAPSKVRHGYCGGFKVNNAAPGESMRKVSEGFNKASGVQLRHWIISFDPREINEPAAANEIAIGISEFFAREYQVVYAVHEDKPHLHIHIVQNSVSYIDGHRYRGTKEEFYRFKKHLYRTLSAYGVRSLNYVSACEGVENGVF